MKLYRHVDLVLEEIDAWILGYAYRLEKLYPPGGAVGGLLEQRMRALQDVAIDLIAVRDKIGEIRT